MKPRLRLATVKESRAFAIFLRPDREIFARGINVGALLEEIQELGASEFIIHNEAIPLEKQLADKDLSSWLEILLTTTQSVETIKDVFLFMKPLEYSILELAGEQDFASAHYQSQINLKAEEISNRKNILENLRPGIFSKDGPIVRTPHLETITSLTEGNDDTQEDTKVTRKPKTGSSISVTTKKLDQLINIVSELVIFRSELSHLMGNEQNPAITEALEKLDRLTLGLRDSAFTIRLVPINILNVKLQRLIRSISKELGKEVEFITDGLETELDRSMINALEAPLMHIIRNAIDHGIEHPDERERLNKPRKGLLKLLSYNSGDHVFIQIQDDGNGINFDRIRNKGIEKGMLNKNQHYSEKELINLMMSPGFSTAEKVTTVSGRGVGMDAVKKDISSMRGDIEVSTEKELGTIITLRLPLTLTVLDTLVVQVDENKYLIPINEVEHCFKDKHENLFRKKSRQITYDGQLTPFVSLREYFGVEALKGEETVIVINKNDTRIAIVVDGIIGKLQTVYKPLNDLLPANCFSGSSILGDGSMALIINALKLNQLSFRTDGRPIYVKGKDLRQTV
jgi:two-component system chemotaxis sensor kinase CheA